MAFAQHLAARAAQMLARGAQMTAAQIESAAQGAQRRRQAAAGVRVALAQRVEQARGDDQLAARDAGARQIAADGEVEPGRVDGAASPSAAIWRAPASRAASWSSPRACSTRCASATRTPAAAWR
ncbi:MAG: hypothetical protein AAF772_20385, partial [Acidobacteriota bacterium]